MAGGFRSKSLFPEFYERRRIAVCPGSGALHERFSVSGGRVTMEFQRAFSRVLGFHPPDPPRCKPDA